MALDVKAQGDVPEAIPLVSNVALVKNYQNALLKNERPDYNKLKSEIDEFFKQVEVKGKKSNPNAIAIISLIGMQVELEFLYKKGNKDSINYLNQFESLRRKNTFFLTEKNFILIPEKNSALFLMNWIPLLPAYWEKTNRAGPVLSICGPVKEIFIFTWHH